MANRRYIGGLLITKGERQDEWIVTVNGIDHIIYFEKNKKVRECKLFVDNKEIEIPQNFMTKYMAIDHPIQIEGKIVRCVYEGNMFDLVVCGEYINREEKYYPIQKVWTVMGPVAIFMGILFVIAMEYDRLRVSKLIPEKAIFPTVLIVVCVASLYMERLHIKEKKGGIIEEKRSQIKKYKRRIWTMYILAIFLIIAIFAAITVMNIEIPLIVLILLWLWFIGGGRYVVHLWKKVRELERG